MTGRAIGRRGGRVVLRAGRVALFPDRTIEWPGGIDLGPDVLYGNFEPASGVRLARRTIRDRTSAHS